MIDVCGGCCHGGYGVVVVAVVVVVVVGGRRGVHDGAGNCDSGCARADAG